MRTRAKLYIKDSETTRRLKTFLVNVTSLLDSQWQSKDGIMCYLTSSTEHVFHEAKKKKKKKAISDIYIILCKVKQKKKYIQLFQTFMLENYEEVYVGKGLHTLSSIILVSKMNWLVWTTVSRMKSLTVFIRLWFGTGCVFKVSRCKWKILLKS